MIAYLPKLRNIRHLKVDERQSNFNVMLKR